MKYITILLLLITHNILANTFEVTDLVLLVLPDNKS
jgi:hypothetical protein